MRGDIFSPVPINFKPSKVKENLLSLINTIPAQVEDQQVKDALLCSLHKLDLEHIDAKDAAIQLPKFFRIVDQFLIALARTVPLHNGGVNVKKLIGVFWDTPIHFNFTSSAEAAAIEYMEAHTGIANRATAIAHALALPNLNQLSGIYKDAVMTQP